MYFYTQLFLDAPPVVQVLGLLQLAFTVWMMVDASHRRADTFWYWVIICFQPIGVWAYFFAVKFRTPRLTAIHPTLPTADRRLSLAELRFSVEHAPTVANRFALAQRLMETSAYAEAIPLLEAVLAVEPNYCAVLHALAECRLATGEAERALGPLQTLIRRDHRWANYLAWHTLVRVHLVRGRPAEALEACRELSRHQPSLRNKCLLAEQLLGTGSPAEAVRVLQEALVEHRFSPWAARWQNRRWAREARRLCAEAETVGRAKAGVEIKHRSAEEPDTANRPRA